jgi:hypothetical protein
MSRYARLRSTLLLFAVAVLGGARLLSAQAEAPPAQRELIYPIHQIDQLDNNGDGLPDETQIRMSFVSDNDLVRVIDGGRDMQASGDWRAATDFENDAWVFDAYADGTAQLVIQFQRRADGHVYALVYPDVTEDGVVSYVINNGVVEVRENITQLPTTPPLTLPTVTISAPDDWFMPDGRLNYNVRFLVDGPHLSLIDGSTYTMGLVGDWHFAIQLDGIADAEFEFRDTNQDGIPDYGLWNYLGAETLAIGYRRSFLWANSDHYPTNVSADILFFPYLEQYETNNAFLNPLGETLGIGQRERDERYFDYQPRLEVAWTTAQLTPVLLRGYPIEQGYHFTSLNSIYKDRVNYVNFENMQAYYDMAEDDDGYPELHIRVRNYPAFDPRGWDLPTDVTEIRWSWNQSNITGDLFDYKVSLGARHPLDTLIAYPDFSYYTIPYPEAGDWIQERRWDLAAFITSEGRLYASTEGIYEWNTVEVDHPDDDSFASQYIAGTGTVEIAPFLNTIPRNMRGEFADPYDRQPSLYFSPVDQKLHLTGANFCLWNIDDLRQIRCNNLNGDDYLDYWSLFEEPPPIQEENSVAQTFSLNITPYLPLPDHQLLHTSDYLVYSGESSVFVRQQSVEAALFTTPPPHDYAGWRTLSDLLAVHQSDPRFDATNLIGMYAQFSGPELRIKNARALEFKTTDTGGYQFVLEVLPDFEIDQILPFAVDIPAPGRYLVELDGARFNLRPMTPAQIMVQIEQPFDVPGTAETLVNTPLSVVIENRGLETVNLLRLQVRADALDPDTNAVIAGEGGVISDSIITVSGSSSERVDLEWAVPHDGQWRFEALVEVLDISSLDALLTDVSKLTNVRSLEDLFVIGKSPLNDAGDIQLVSQLTVNARSQPIATEAFLSLGGQQPLGGVLVVLMLVAVVIAGASVFVLILRRT